MRVPVGARLAAAWWLLLLGALVTPPCPAAAAALTVFVDEAEFDGAARHRHGATAHRLAMADTGWPAGMPAGDRLFFDRCAAGTRARSGVRILPLPNEARGPRGAPQPGHGRAVPRDTGAGEERPRQP